MAKVWIERLEDRRLLNALPRLQLFVDQSIATENSSQSVQFSVVRNAVGLGSALTVNLAYSGSAGAGSDYLAGPTSVTIPANQRVAQVSLTPINDAASESTESVVVTIQPAATYTLGPTSTRSGTAQIYDDDSLGAGSSVLANPPTWTSYGATHSTVSVTGQPFTTAQRLIVAAPGQHSYDAAMQTHANVAIAKGSKLLLRFWARTTNPNAVGSMVAVVQQSGPPWEKSLFMKVNLSGDTWREYLIPFEAVMSYTTLPNSNTRALVEFQIGDTAQDIQIAGVTLTNYGTTISLDQLPRSAQTYQGRLGADFAWRDAAEARIEQLRKGDLTLRLRDSSDNTIENATVRIRLKKHAFGFGSSVDSPTLLGLTGISQTDLTNYRSNLLRYFSAKAVPENDLKQGPWESFPQRAIAGIDWLNANGIDDIRGHNLIWPSWQYMASSPGLFSYGGIPIDRDPNKENSLEEYELRVQIDGLAAANNWLRNRIATHITQQISHPQLVGRVVDWDVMNEGVYNTDVQNILGDAVMTQWYQLARQANPGAKLFMNDYPPMYKSAHEDAYVQLIQNMLNEGAPIDGIGLQSHFNFETPGIDQMQASFDRFAAFNKEIQITEYDSRVVDQQLRADFTRDYMLLAFSQPRVTAFINWGFWAGMHYLPEAALFDQNWNIRPHGQVWIDHVTNVWSTDVTKTPDATPVRAFFGDYEFVVTVGSRTFKRTATFNQSGTITLTIPDDFRPVATASFNFEPAHEARFVFDQDVLASVSSDDFEVRNVTTQSTLSSSSFSLQATNVNGKTVARLVFTPLLSDGRYAITLKPASVAGSAGLTNANATTISTFVLAGDANRDGSVNFSDLVVLARNFNTTGRTFSQGNFDYDPGGNVNFSDLVLLARNFNVSLAPTLSTRPGLSRLSRQSDLLA